jgi:uncharacterized protein (DUF1800 family)
MGNVHWLYYLVNTQRPLEEKMALFWHHVFATGNSKVDNYDQCWSRSSCSARTASATIANFLSNGLVQRDDDVLARQQPEPRHRGERELGPRAPRAVQPRRRQLHRDDVANAPRAFTGWTFETKIPRLPYGRFPWKFEYRPEDHDDGEKVFLGHKGRFNGEDILDIVVQQPACGRFICRHLYNFFVADEPQVPAWPIESPRDQKAIDEMVGVFRDSKFEMKAVLRHVFNSDWFKEARFQHVKSPAEVVVSTLRFVGGYEIPKPGLRRLSMNTAYMGQDLLQSRRRSRAGTPARSGSTAVR